MGPGGAEARRLNGKRDLPRAQSHHIPVGSGVLRPSAGPEVHLPRKAFAYGVATTVQRNGTLCRSSAARVLGKFTPNPQRGNPH